MLIAVIALAVALALALVVIAVERRAARAHFHHATVIIQTRDGHSLRGVLMARHADRVTLADAFALGDPEVPIAGLAHVPAANVAWMQELPAELPATS